MDAWQHPILFQVRERLFIEMPSDLNPIQTLISYLSNQPQDKSTQEIGEALEMNRNLVSKYLTILHMQGRVELRTYGTLKMYRLSNRVPFQSITDIINGVCLGLDRLLIVKEVGNDPLPFFREPVITILGKRCTDINHPCFDDESFVMEIKNLLEGKKTDVPGREYWVDQICHMVNLYQTVFFDGSPGIAITFTNITDEKKIQGEFESLHQQYTYLTKNSQEMILHLSPNKTILYTNLAYSKNFDLEPSAIIGTIYEPLIPSEDIKHFNKAFTSLSEKNQTQIVDHRVVMKDGSIRWQKWVITAFFFQKEISEYYLSGSDTTKIKLMESQIHQFELGLENILREKTDELREVTRNLYKEIEDRKRLEREISQKEELFRNLTESTTDIIWENNTRGDLTYINPVFCKTLGFTHEDMIGKSLFTFLEPDSANQLRETFLYCLEKNKPFNQIDLPFLDSKSNVIIIELSGVVSLDYQGKITGIRGIGRDITARKKSEIEKEKLLTIIEQSPELIGICDIQGMVQYINPTGIKMLDIPPDTDLHSLQIDIFVQTRSKIKVTNGIKTALKQGHWRGETTLTSWNGKEIPVSQVIVSHQPSPKESPLLFTICHDISELIYHDRELSRMYAYNQNLIETSLDPLVTISHDGTIQGANTATEEVIGLLRDDLIGTDFNQYFLDSQKAKEAFIKAFSDGYIRDYRLEIKHQDGGITPVLFNASVYRDESGKIQGVFAAARDMSNLYHIEAELRESLEYYLKILNDFPNPIWRSGIDKKFNYFNKSWFDFTGRTFNQEIGNGWREGIHPDDRDDFLTTFTNSYTNRVPFSVRYRLRRRNGSYHWLISYGAPLFSKQGEFSGYIGSCYDVDKIIKAKENIRISERKYRQLHDSMMDGYVSVDLEGNILECNESFREMLGFSDDELMKMSFYDFTPEKWQSEDKKIQNLVLERGYSDVYEKEYCHKNGTTFPIELRKVLSKDERGNPISMWAIVRDITDRKEVEKTLIENKNNLLSTHIQLIAQNESLKKSNEEISRLESRYRSLFENGPAGYLILDESGKVCEINPEGMNYLGCSRDQITGKKFNSYIMPVHHQAYTTFFEKLCQSGNNQSVELQLLRGKSSTIYVYLKGSVITSLVDGKEKIQIAMIDISQAKIAEEKIKESEAKYRLLADHSTDVIWLLDIKSSKFTYISPSVYKLLGYAPEEIIASSLEKIFSPISFTTIKENLPIWIAAYKSGDESARVAIHEIDVPRKDGSIIHTEVVTTLLHDPDRSITKILGVSRNVTSRKIAEQKSAQSQEYYRILFESSYYGVIFLDNFGAIVSSNPAAERILGVSVGQMQRRPSGDARWKAIHEDGTPFIGDEYPSILALKTGKIIKNVPMGVFNPMLDRYVWIKITAIPLFHPGEEKPYQVYTIFEDITEQKNLEKTVQNWHDQAVLLTTFLEHSIQPFGISYLDGTLWYVNSALATLLKCSVEEVSTSTNVVTGNSPVWLRILIGDKFSFDKGQKQLKLERDLMRKDGSSIPVVIYAHIISDETNEPVYYYLLINDRQADKK